MKNKNIKIWKNEIWKYESIRDRKYEIWNMEIWKYETWIMKIENIK